MEATAHLLVLVILAVVDVVKHNRLLLVALYDGTCKYPVQLYPKPSLMGTIAGTRAREARSASLALSPLAGSRRCPLLSSVDLGSFLCWNLNPVRLGQSLSPAEKESCPEGRLLLSSEGLGIDSALESRPGCWNYDQFRDNLESVGYTDVDGGSTGVCVQH